MKVYILKFAGDEDGQGIFPTLEQAQSCIDMMLSEYASEGVSPDHFIIEEHYTH